jgi:hypothetical protein
MKIIDAYLLARTKRKTRRIRTALVTTVSSLLFSVLFFAVIVGGGVFNSADQVKNVGFNSRYLTAILPITNSIGIDYESTQNRIKAEMDAELRTRKITVTDDIRKDQSYQLEFVDRLSSFFADQTVRDVAKSKTKLQSMGNKSAFYSLLLTDLDQHLTYQPDFTQDAKLQQLVAEQNQTSTTPKTLEHPLEFFVVEKDLLRTQLLPGQSFDWKPGQPIPVGITYTQLEQLSGRSFTNVDAAIKNAGYKQLISEYTGKVLNYCYRNSTANQQLQAVVIYNKQAAQDKDKTTNPIATPICQGFDQALLKKIGLITEPSATDPKPLFPARPQPAPITTKMELKIVALTPASSQFGSSDILETLLTNVGSLPFVSNPLIIPSEVMAQNKLLQPEFDARQFGLQTTFFADFATRKDQKDFLALGCNGDECAANTKPYMVPFGNLGVALENAVDAVWSGAVIAIGVTMGIAGLMIFFTISKVIADSTKEIAVFRALGARRRDIAQIYFTYGGMLAFSSLLFAVLLGGAVAFSANLLYGDRFAALMVQTTGAYTQNPHMSLLGYQPTWLFGVAGALVIAALIGISIPIIAAVNRKLINILREE